MTSPLFASLAGYRRDWMVVNGSLSKTAVNGGAGARSQASGLVVAGLTIVTLLLLTGLFEELPEATLAAVVIAAVIELVDFGALADLWRATTTQLGRIYGVAARPELIAAVAAMLGVLVFDTLPSLFIGVAISFVLLVYRTSRPNVAVLGREPNMGVFVDMARDPGPPRSRASSCSGPSPASTSPTPMRSGIGSSTRWNGRVRRPSSSTPRPSRSIDVTAVRMLDELAADLARREVRLALARDVGQVRDLLSRVRSESQVRTFPTVRAAVTALTRSS
jgi:MFS superfamily sulfate permease-like transporter